MPGCSRGVVPAFLNPGRGPGDGHPGMCRGHQPVTPDLEARAVRVVASSLVDGGQRGFVDIGRDGIRALLRRGILQLEPAVGRRENVEGDRRPLSGSLSRVGRVTRDDSVHVREGGSVEGRAACLEDELDLFSRRCRLEGRVLLVGIRVRGRSGHGRGPEAEAGDDRGCGEPDRAGALESFLHVREVFFHVWAAKRATKGTDSEMLDTKQAMHNITIARACAPGVSA
jgi:hypothetical protein